MGSKYLTGGVLGQRKTTLAAISYRHHGQFLAISDAERLSSGFIVFSDLSKAEKLDEFLVANLNLAAIDSSNTKSTPFRA